MFNIKYPMLLVDIPAEIQISGGYIEQYPAEDVQFNSIGYDSYFKMLLLRYSY